MAAKRRSVFDGLVQGGDFTEAEQLLASVIVTIHSASDLRVALRRLDT